jgi:hypothetical protein
MALVEVLYLFFFSLSDFLFEMFNTLSQLVEVAIDSFEVCVELVNQLLSIICYDPADSTFDLLSHFIQEIIDVLSLRLIDELVLDLDYGVNHFCDSLLLLH